MYILLDENLGGGVSLQKNLAVLPEKFRKNALEGRKAVERDILLGPILASLESGNALQREALVRSFDGTFFKGRTYARQPSGMLDVGNDREFGFLDEPSPELLDRAFAALLASDANPEVRRRSIQLASFFQVPSRSTNGPIQLALMKGLADADPAILEAAKRAVSDDLELRGAESDPARIAAIRTAIREVDSRKAVVRAIARNRGLMANPEIIADLRSILGTGDPRSLLPVFGHPAFTDAEVVAAIARAWPDSSESADRLGLLIALLSRPGLVDSENPPAPAVEVLRTAIVDRSAGVREAALGAVGRLREGKLADRLVLVGLADDSPGLRRMALGLAGSRAAFWSGPEPRERLLALLVDPDATVRERALEVVDRQRLARGAPVIARRVKALAGDSALKARAEACLANQGFDPALVEPDLTLGRPRLLSFSTFRDRVNPLFYQAGDDGHSCASCHANHGVLRVGEANGADSPLINYNSALKVVNFGEPESSLLLRKPRSPRGQGSPDESSPTGLTHVGGPRWESVEHPSYRAILEWIREASADASASSRINALASADGHAPGFEPSLAVDGDPATSWRTEFLGATPGYPHELILDLGAPRRVEGLLYIPRQDASSGRVKDYEVELSDDGKTWSTTLARGTWPDDPAFQFVNLPGRLARFVKLRGLSEVNGLPFMSVGEVDVDARSNRLPVKPDE